MDVVKLTQELVKINSSNPPGNEKKIALFVRDFLADSGIQVMLIESDKNRFNVVASLGKGKPGLMLNGHLDTVPAGSNWKYDPWSGKIVGGKIFGLGTTDMKGGVAAILIAARTFAKTKLKRKLLLTFVADEEGGTGKGTRYLIQKKKSIFSGIKYGVVGEQTSMKIRIAQKGLTRAKIIFKGKAAHGSKPELGDSAILKASDFIQATKKLEKKLKKKKHKLLGSGTINIGTIKGGIKVNIVPDRCELEIDRRIVPGETPKTVLKQFKDILKKLKLKADIKVGKGRLPHIVPPNSRIVQELLKVRKTKLIAEIGYAEAELFHTEAGIECVVCGPSIGDLCHTANEYCKISELKRAVKVYEGLIKRMCL